MRSIVLAGLLILGGVSPGVAQVSQLGEAAVTYHWLRTNATPGNCGCFDLNGGGVSATWNLRPEIAVVGEISAEHSGNVLSSGRSLTLTSYMGGARYGLPQRLLGNRSSLQPFVQVLLGGAHAGGSAAGSGDGAFAFSARVGGGLDLNLSSRFAIRIFQVDYDLTRFANASNQHQNNLLVGAGIVFRWSSRGKILLH